MLSHDKNGLEFSNASDSGYKFVTTFFDGPLVGKFIAFADVKGDYLQTVNRETRTRVAGFFGFKNVVALGIYDDVRAAAYVGQSFYGKDSDDRDMNLEALFSGDESVICTPPSEWLHPADIARMEGARKRAVKRSKADVQAALAAFNKEHGSDYKVSRDNAATIRAVMNAYLGTIAKPKVADAMEAARLAFEPYKK